MQASLSLSHEVDACIASGVVGDQPREHSSLAHLTLLQALPAVRVREHKVDLVLQRVPQTLAASVCVDDVPLRAGEEVRQKVSEDVDGSLTARKRCHVFGLETV